MARKYDKLEPSPDAARAAEGWILCHTTMSAGEGKDKTTKPFSYETFGGDLKVGTGTPPLDMIRNFGAFMSKLVAGALAEGAAQAAIDAAVKEYDRWVYGVDLGARSGEKSGGDSPVMAIPGRVGVKINFHTGEVFEKDIVQPEQKRTLAQLLNSINRAYANAADLGGAVPKAIELARELHLSGPAVILDPNGNLIPAEGAPAGEPAKPNGGSRRR